ncbi:hypothetical protein [Novosphingobium sp.]|uniref:hypothetical protein n=1 Tax=Novosphingobium sp. TaxID=1874826 RepID=UPI002736C421|nr:hypothetical protein [Novosphingobium sp.]MDP3908710.1 hypothetical protein [Novosphingobium sp.]
MPTWLTVAEFAELAGITRQAAHAAAKMASRRRAWRGCFLSVRQVAGGRGGRSGTRYEVALSSLSEPLQAAYLDLYSSPPAPTCIGRETPIAPNQGARIEKRYRVIQEAIECEPRSVERKAEVLRAAKKWNIPARTIYRWIADLEASGGDVNALARKLPADAGQRRVWVSRPFDRAYLEAGYPATDLPELGEVVDQLIRRGWTSPAQRAGWKQVRRVVLTMFRLDLQSRGIELPATALALSQRRIVAAQDYRIVDIQANDRKRYDDMKPRIRRDNSKFAPMEQIVMDVKPLDCIVMRPDGSTTWPKMIGFMDTGTHRLFRHFVPLPPGEGVRQEHVAEAFIRMVTHPEWGFPQQVYRDNGTEFYIMDMVRDALAMLNAPGARTIINAKPYNGAAKPIESKFATLDRFVFSQMGGWAGGNRMNKKTQTVGMPPKPYSGSFEDFAREADERIEVFEHEPIGSGVFKGKSPQGCFAEHVAAGWRPVIADADALDAAFSRRETRRVDRGAVSIMGQLFRHPELPNGQTVTIAVPWRRGANPLANIPDFGWASLISDMPYLPGEIEGAVETARMQRRNDKSTQARRKAAPPIDIDAAHRAQVTILPTRAAPAPIMDVLASQAAQEMAAAKRAVKEVATLPTPAERRRAARERENELLERALGRK